MYIGILSNKGKEIEDDETLFYCISNITDSEFKEFTDCYTNKYTDDELVEWYFSGNWVYEENQILQGTR